MGDTGTIEHHEDAIRPREGVRSRGIGSVMTRAPWRCSIKPQLRRLACHDAILRGIRSP
jgi:hypothetical protein